MRREERVGKVEDNQQRTQEPQQLRAVFSYLRAKLLLFGRNKRLLPPEQMDPAGSGRLAFELVFGLPVSKLFVIRTDARGTEYQKRTEKNLRDDDAQVSFDGRRKDLRLFRADEDVVVVRHGVQVVSIAADGLQAAVAVHQRGFRQGVCDGPRSRGVSRGPEEGLGRRSIGMHFGIGFGVDPEKRGVDVRLLSHRHQAVVRYGDVNQAGIFEKAARGGVKTALVRQFSHQGGVRVSEQVPELVLIVVRILADLITDIQIR